MASLLHFSLFFLKSEIGGLLKNSHVKRILAHYKYLIFTKEKIIFDVKEGKGKKCKGIRRILGGPLNLWPRAA